MADLMTLHNIMNSSSDDDDDDDERKPFQKLCLIIIETKTMVGVAPRPPHPNKKARTTDYGDGGG